jgi:hypothetical protein
MFSAVLPTTDIAQRGLHVRFVREAAEPDLRLALAKPRFR